MVPWPVPPRSLAGGILDDETYDWMAVIRGMLLTGGYPVVVSEKRLAEAYDIARQLTGSPADHTGAAGLAGYLHLRARGAIGADETTALILTGRERQDSSARR
jgi:threonine synthase